MSLQKYLAALPLLLISLSPTAQDSIGLPDLKAAEKLFDLNFTPVKEDSILSGLADHLQLYKYLHKNNLYNSVPLSLAFDPLLPGITYDRKQIELHWNIPPATTLPANKNDLAYYSIPELASLIKRKKISSVELTKFFLDRLRRYGPILHCVIELREDSALAEAARADNDLNKGIYRSPLQGIPYGIKDLFAVR